MLRTRNLTADPPRDRAAKQRVLWAAFVAVLFALFGAAVRTLMATSQPLLLLVLPVLFGILFVLAIAVHDAMLAKR